MINKVFLILIHSNCVYMHVPLIVKVLILGVNLMPSLSSVPVWLSRRSSSPHGLTETPLGVSNASHEEMKQIITVAQRRQRQRETQKERDADFLPSPPRLLWTALAPRGFWQLLPALPFDWWGPSQMFPSPNQWEFKCFVHVNSRHNITGSGPCRSLAASLLISPLNVSKAPHESGPSQRQPMEMEGSLSFASSSILSRMLLLNVSLHFRQRL